MFTSDYNYQRAADGSCQLVPGLTPPDHIEQCNDNPELTSYFLPTAYRLTPLDTCQGGLELDKTSEELPCPGHEADFEEVVRKRGLGGFWFFVLVVLLPVALASGVGYWVYGHWDGKFGRIRLGDGGAGGDVFDADKPWIKWPIVALSAVVAVVAAMPLVLASAWRGVLGLVGRGGGYGRLGGAGGGGVNPYTSRGDFARGSRFSVGDVDEDELLGEDDEEGEIGAV